jgi:O-antigen/teichoic acid export membrane protein
MLGLLLLRFEQQNFKFLIVILAKVFAMLGSVYFFVIYLRSGLPGVFSAQILANVGALGVVLFFCRSYLNTKFSKVNSRILFKYSLPQFPARLGSMCLGEMNRFFLLHFLSIQAIGVFSLSLKVASMIQLVNMAFLMAWAPVMFALFKQENNKQIFSQVFNLVCCVTFMIVCIISLFAKEVVELIVQKEDFRTAFRYVGGLALFYALYIVKEVVDIGPKYTHKTYYISYNFFFSVLLNLVALYFFIKYFELNGVVYAMVLTNLGLVLISWFTSNRLYYIPFNKTLFVVLLLPAMALCYYAMETDLHLWVRICILMIVLAFYLTIGYQYFRKIRTNQWLV